MQTMETPDRRTENAVERNLEAARRLFRAVEHRDRAGVMAAYDENIVINEASKSAVWRRVPRTRGCASPWTGLPRNVGPFPAPGRLRSRPLVRRPGRPRGRGLAAEGREHADRTKNRSARRQHLPLC